MSSTIEIRLDGNARVVETPITLAELIAGLDDVHDSVATAINGEFVPRHLRSTRGLSGGDSVTLVRLIVGG